MPYFDIGDKAIVVDGIDKEARRLIGEVVTITSELRIGFHSDNPKLVEFYIVNDEKTIKSAFLGFDSARVAFRPTDLKPYYDGNEEASWENCVWRPQPLEVT